MAYLNEVKLIGRLTRDPELKKISSGSSVCEFGFCTNRKYKGSDGAWQDETTFIEISCWAKLAEIVTKYCKKGNLIFIGGRIKFDSWEDKQSGQKGQKRSRLYVIAENVQFLDGKRISEDKQNDE